MAKKSVLVSVIIPVYNSGKYLRECVESVFSQSYEEYEIILVDDGSTDDSGAICDWYAQKENIKVIHQVNKKQYAARYAGFSMARGEYVMHIDADDWIEPNMMTEMVEYARRDDADIVTSAIILERYGCQSVDCDGVETGLYDGRKIGIICDNLITKTGEENHGFNPGVVNKLIKKSLLLKTYQGLGKDICIGYDEDLMLTYASLSLAETVVITKNKYYHYRQNLESITNKATYDRYLFDIAIIRERLGYIFSQSCYSESLLRQLDIFTISRMWRACGEKGGFAFDASLPLYDLPKALDVFSGRIILYGAGLVGKSYIKQISNRRDISIVSWTDKNINNMSSQMNNKGISDFHITSLEIALSMSFDIILLAIQRKEIADNVRDELIKKYRVDKKKILWVAPKYAYERYINI